MNINGLRNRSLRSKLKTNASMSNQRSRKKALIKSPNLFLNLIKLVLVAILLVYISALLAIKYSSTVRRWFLFMNYVNYQACCYNLSRPELDYGLSCTRVFRVNSTDSIQLGVWHILPYSRNSECFDGVGIQFKSHVMTPDLLYSIYTEMVAQEEEIIVFLFIKGYPMIMILMSLHLIIEATVIRLIFLQLVLV